MTNHGRTLVERIRADHIPTRVRIPGRIRRRMVCQLCGQPAPCNRLALAADIEAGRRDSAGQPTMEDVTPWPTVWRLFLRWLPLLVVLAAVFGWPGADLIADWVS